MSCIYKYKGKDYTKEEFYSLVSNSNFIQQEQVKKFVQEEKDDLKPFIDESNKIGEQIRDVEDIQETKPNRQLGLFDNNTYHQLPKSREKEEYVASEKTIRDLAARMSDRIGIPVRFESDRTKEYKGKIENNVAYINLAYATLDTPIHEILGHPIIRAIKNKQSKFDVILPIGTSGSGKSTFIKSLPQENLVIIEPDAMRVEFTGDMNDKSKDKEIYIEAANRAITAIRQGKQVVFDTTNLTKDKRLPFIEAIKKVIPSANIQYKLMELNPELAKQRIKAQLEKGENRANVSDATIDRHAESYKQMLEDIKSEPISNLDEKTSLYQNLLKELETGKGKEVLDRVKRDYATKLIKGTAKDVENLKRWEERLTKDPNDEIAKTWRNEVAKKIEYGKYTLEEQQEEAIVELMSLMVADKLNKITDKNLISLLKQLLKQINDFIKSLLNTKELNINDIEADNTKFLIENKLKELIKNGTIKKEC